MTQLVAQLFAVFLPIVRDLVTKYQAAHEGKLPTDEEMKAAFEAHIAEYLAEGATWKAGHPKV